MSKPTVLFTLAGVNTRLYPLNAGIHKSGLTLLGKPLVVRSIEAFLDHGYDEFVVVISPDDDEVIGMKPTLKAYFPELPITFVIQAVASGMGDAVLAAKEYLHGTFIYTSGYHFQAADIVEDMAMFETPNVICTATTQHPWDYGIVTIEGQLAKGITEKPAKGTEASDQKIQTIYKLDSEFIQTLSQLESSEYSFEAALDILMKANKVGHLQLSTCLASLKYPWHLFDLQTELFELQTSYLHPTAQISSTAILDESKGSIVIEANAQIGDFVKIVGPVFIGENCRVGDYSFIRQTSLEADSTIGANSEVVRSVIFSRSSLHYSYVADSIIGNHVKIGAGFITANKRLNRETIQIRVKNKPTNTGRTAVGTIIGEDVNLGIRVSTMPGVMIGPRATVFPGICLYNSVPSDEVIKK